MFYQEKERTDIITTLNNVKINERKGMVHKRILYCASTASHIMNFHLPYLQYFQDLGWEVDVVVGSKAVIPFASNVIDLPFEKRLLAFNNIHAVNRIRRILNEKRYDIISLHTTLAAAVTRFAIFLTGKRNGKIVYTSHGYFFDEKSMITGWPYILVEKFLSQVTDLLMVMNEADYNLARRYKLCKDIKYIPGMGLNMGKFRSLETKNKSQEKEEAGFSPDDFLILYAAEMSKRKNQAELIKAFALAAAVEPSMKLLLAGDGDMKDEYFNLAQKIGFSDSIYFLGHVPDMGSLYKICDLAVSTSRIEGLPFNVMEAMTFGLPVIASRIKGHIDLLGNLTSDCLYDLGDEYALKEKILLYYSDQVKIDEIGRENSKNVLQYCIEKVKPLIIKNYSWLLKDN